MKKGGVEGSEKLGCAFLNAPLMLPAQETKLEGTVDTT